MAFIVIADDGTPFDGRLIERQPLGGAETAVVEVAEALAARGHDVMVCNSCPAPLDHKGVRWRPIADGVPEAPDLYVANRGDKLLLHARQARVTAFWLHNPGRYARKWRYQWKLAWRWPQLIFTGDYHRSTYRGLGGPRHVIPLGVSRQFHGTLRTDLPPPRAVFASNPMRSLDWLLDVWAERIRPAVPTAELHVFAGKQTYGAAGEAWASRIKPALDKAEAMAGHGVVLRGPVGKEQLAAEYTQARCMLYRGDRQETFCLAVAEAQAMGLPAVVEDIGSMRERVADGQTGFVVNGAEAFAERAIAVLSDDALWRRQHAAAIAGQDRLTWDVCAQGFEKLLP